MTDPASTVFIVDDDEDFRDSVEVLCSSVELRARSFASAREFLDAWSDDWQGCILLDVRMPEISGLELQSILRERHCSLPILFITGHGDVEMAVQAMKLGADDFLTKPLRNNQELLDRIHGALRRSVVRWEEEKELEAMRDRLARLTPREREVFELVVEGCANKVISNRLGISQRTVELHRSQVMSKMEADSLADLVRLAIQLDGAEDR